MKKSLWKITSLVLVMMLSLAMFSATSLAVSGGTMTFDKYLVMNENVNIPNVTFNYSINAGEHVDATLTTPEILAGPTGAAIGTASFSSTDTAYTTVQVGDNVTLAAGQKYVKKAVTVTLTGVDFDAPGVYRYVITEQAPTHAGIVNDAQAVRWLDVYVESDNAGTLSINSTRNYILHNANTNPPTAGGPWNAKSTGYTNTYSTSSLLFSKTVTGNQGYHQKHFKFTVNITGAQSGTVYTVTANEALTAPDGAVTNANPATISVESNGQARAVFYLKHNQSVTINGMTAGTEYTVTEEPDGYTPSYVLNGAASQNGATATGTISTTLANTVAFTNNRTGTVPTGVLMDVAPYVLIVTIALAALLVLVLKKRKTSR